MVNFAARVLSTERFIRFSAPAAHLGWRVKNGKER
jgi:hypothetical protein